MPGNMYDSSLQNVLFNQYQGPRQLLQSGSARPKITSTGSKSGWTNVPLHKNKENKWVLRQLPPTPISYAPVIFLKFFPLYHNKPILSNENRDYYIFGKYQPKYLGTMLSVVRVDCSFMYSSFLARNFQRAQGTQWIFTL